MDKIEKQRGLVWMPYTIVNTTDGPSKEYKDFMSEYKEKHKCCPKCGSDDCITTLVGYILNMDKKDEYEDKNICVCSDCGNRHTVHERNNPELTKNQNRFDKLKDILQ